MATEIKTVAPAPFDFSRWRNLPVIFMIVGGALSVLGFFVNRPQFGYSWLQNFMFFMAICVGGWFLVLVHHLFDASWSVPIRRISETLASLLPWLAIFFVPIYLLRREIYPWLGMLAKGESDHALHAKAGLFSEKGFLIVSVICFVLWWLNTMLLRRNSYNQDDDGSPRWTLKNRVAASWGIVVFALSVTMAVIMWMKSLQHQWFSTMYGVYYFAGAVWTALATLYVLAAVLKRSGPLAAVVGTRQMHDIGVLWLAFTVFYAYIHFSQYFLSWNANIPEETFYYVKREQGSWWQICMLLVFGHFLFPFLTLLRIDMKLKLTVMIPLAIWAWLMHFCDMSFNIMPLIHKEGFTIHVLDLACMAFIGGVLSLVFIKYFKSHQPYPVNDPRLGEALGIHSYPE